MSVMPAPLAEAGLTTAGRRPPLTLACVGQLPDAQTHCRLLPGNQGHCKAALFLCRRDAASPDQTISNQVIAYTNATL